VAAGGAFFPLPAFTSFSETPNRVDCSAPIWTLSAPMDSNFSNSSLWRREVREKLNFKFFRVLIVFVGRFAKEVVPHVGDESVHAKYSSHGRPLAVAQATFQSGAFLPHSTFVPAKV